MPLTSMTQGLLSLDLGTDSPEFVNLHPRYTCVCCHLWLKEPMQTLCGHRICRSCCDKLLAADNVSNHGRGFPCPAKEDGCELITPDKVYPDHSALREIRQQEVFCPYRKYGCGETPKLGKLKEHMGKCTAVQGCPHCKERIVPDHLDSHIRDECPAAPITCQYCGSKDIPRQQMDGHHKICLLKPQRCKFFAAGCHAEYPRNEIAEHEKDVAVHMSLAAEFVSKLEADNARLADRVQTMQAGLQAASEQMSCYYRENELLKRQIDELKSAQRQSEMRNSQLMKQQSERIAQLEQQLQILETKTQEVSQVKAKCVQLETRLNEAGPLRHQEVSLPEDVRKKFITQDRTIGLHDVRLSELDLRLQCTETANYEGVLIWKIGEYRDRKKQAVEGRILSLYSQPFYTSRYGYKMCARVYLNGDGVGRGTHMSLFFVVMQGDYDEILAWPFRQKVTLTLLDQLNNRRHLSDTFRPDPSSTSFQKPTTPMNVASGCPLFVPHTVLEGAEGLYLRNNTIFIKVVVDTTDLLNP